MNRLPLRPLIALALVAAAALAPATAGAQALAENTSAFTVEHFEPMPGQGMNVLNLATSEVLGHQRPSVGVFAHYMDDPLVLRIDDEEVEALVDGQLKAEVWAAVGLFDVIDLGVVVPLVLQQSGGDLGRIGVSGEIDGIAAADLRLVPKVQLVDPNWARGFGMALAVPISLPFGDADSFNTDRSIRGEPRLIVDWRHEVGLTVIGNLGYQFRPRRTAQNYVNDDVIRWGVGAELPTGVPAFQVITSVFGNIQTEENRAVPNFQRAVDDDFGDPVEALGGLQYALPYDLFVQLGAGGGLNEGVGSPDFRVFASVGMTPTAQDSDQDGIYDDADACADEPEDKDGFEDQDGCPDYDNDDDGIIDADDACPDDAEDQDGFEDDDGCPDTDNDGDEIADADDACPDEAGPADSDGCPTVAPDDTDGDGITDNDDLCLEIAEDVDGFEDVDGCPDLDNDADGIEDTADTCPNEPEDVDDVQDDDGCPETDADKDGIADTADKCPLEPEKINGFEDDDGCPDAGETKVKVTREKVEITEKIYFDTNRAKIKQRSYNLLDQIYAVLRANPQITQIRIEGHTDAKGKEEYNLELSQRRAEAVRDYLIDKGLSADRLIAKGYGEMQPIADNDTAAGREENRRVEFRIVETE